MFKYSESPLSQPPYLELFQSMGGASRGILGGGQSRDIFRGGTVKKKTPCMKGDVLSDNFLMLWFKKDSLDTVGFRNFSTFRGGGGPGALNKIMDFGGPK